MKLPRSRRVFALALVGLLACSVAWLLTGDSEPSRTRGVVNVGLLRQANASNPIELWFTNTHTSSVEILGILVEEASNGEWFEKTNVSIRTNLPPRGFQGIPMLGLSTGQVYRARVGYWSETQGTRLAQNRIKKALKTRRISILWDSSKSQHWTEGTIENLRP